MKREFKPSEDLIAQAKSAVDVFDNKVRRLVTNHPDYFPLYSEQGKWKHGKESWTNWCEGFLGGQMWLLAKHKDSTFWRERAEHYSTLLKGREFDREVHDLGFTFWPTWRPWYLQTNDKALNDVVIQAGKTMGLRFNKKAGFLRSFLAENSTFIDIMMNVGIIYYAAEETNDAELRKIVDTHVSQTRRFLVRGDGSTSHEGIFDLETGEFLKQTTQQGWRDDSSWARGLTWALYGFGTCYSYTQNPDYLDAAERTADFYIRRTGNRFVAPNDWEEPSPIMEYESSAAAIAAAGLLQLSQLTESENKAKEYAEYAFGILDKLTREFTSKIDDSWDGVLLHGSYHEQKKLGVNESVMWGEYFFFEALDRILGGEWLAKDR
jgi:unsaturated chondroitin disaccharide hydrolase